MFSSASVWFGALDCHLAVYETLDSVVLVDAGVRILVGHTGDFDSGRELGAEHRKSLVGHTPVSPGFLPGLSHLVHILCQGVQL